MKVYRATGCGTGEICNLPIPEITAGDDILVNIKYCGICGTDYALSSGDCSFIQNGLATYPIRLGHEWSGVVEKVGLDVKNFKKGDPVVGDNYRSCGICNSCKNKDYNNCTSRNHLGTIDPCWPGTFAEYFVMPERHIYHLSDKIPLMEGALCEPLSVAYGGIKKMDIKKNSVVAVIGTGCIGMAAATLAKYCGAETVYMIGRNQYKLDIAMKLGITATINTKDKDTTEVLNKLTNGHMADFILECSGAENTVTQAVEIAAQKAKIALIGFYEGGIENINTVVSKELNIFGVMGEYGNLEAVTKIMESYDLKLSSIITSIIDFEDATEVFSHPDPNKIIKTIINMQGKTKFYEKEVNV